MKRTIFANTQEYTLRFVAGGGWRSNEHWKRHDKSAALTAFAVIWSSIVFLVNTAIEKPGEASGLFNLSWIVWLLLLPTAGSLGLSFHFWRKEKAAAQHPMSKPIPPYRPRNLY